MPISAKVPSVCVMSTAGVRNPGGGLSYTIRKMVVLFKHFVINVSVCKLSKQMFTSVHVLCGG